MENIYRLETFLMSPSGYDVMSSKTKKEIDDIISKHKKEGTYIRDISPELLCKIFYNIDCDVCTISVNELRFTSIDDVINMLKLIRVSHQR
jgi:hypothetical protein